MATLLPTLASHGANSLMSSYSPTALATKNAKSIQLTSIPVRQMLNKKELMLQERRQAARAKLPDLSEWQTSRFQNSYKHTMCVEMLQSGFHRSFCEIFALIKQQSAIRLSAGPESALWNEKPLSEEHEKLDTMKRYLMEAETASLTGDNFRVYQCHHKLAQYFRSIGDKWLSDHFFKNCLSFSANVEIGDGIVAAQGHRDVGLSLEETGDISQAAHHFELCYELSKGKLDWTLDDNVTPMHSQSCNNLARVYTLISARYKANGDSDMCLTYLTNAYEKAKEGGDRQLYGDASYQLGMAYIRNGRSDIALAHLQSFLETCQALKDSESVGKACEAIAKAHDSQGNIEESIKYLQKFVKVSEESKDDRSLCDACNSLGIKFNSLGKYSQSFDNSSRAYDIARTLDDTTRLSLARVLTGISRGHEMLQGYTDHLLDPSSRKCMSRLLDWKDSRVDEFSKPISSLPDLAAPMAESGEEELLLSEEVQEDEELVKEHLQNVSD